MGEFGGSCEIAIFGRSIAADNFSCQRLPKLKFAMDRKSVWSWTPASFSAANCTAMSCWCVDVQSVLEKFNCSEPFKHLVYLADEFHLYCTFVTMS
jgi:hypothetical protein